MVERAALQHGRIIAWQRSLLTTLSYWIERSLLSQPPWRRSALLGSNPSAFDWASRSGIFFHSGLADHCACPYCEDGHAAELIPNVDGFYRLHCLLNGWVTVSEDDVALATFDRTALLKTLAEAGGQRADIRLFASERLAKLAFVEPGRCKPGWVLAYADGLADENVLGGAIENLRSMFPHGPGLIATPSPIPLTIPLPRSYRLIALEDLFLEVKGRLIIDFTAAESRLGNRGKTLGQTGRPSSAKETERVWSSMSALPTWPHHRKEQAERIMEALLSDGSECPAIGTIENHIRNFEQKVKEKNGTRSR